MVPHMKAIFFILLLIFGCSFSDLADGFKDGAKLPYPNSQGDIQTMARKLVQVEAHLDYDHTGPNPSHTPPDNSGRKGGGINN